MADNESKMVRALLRVHLKHTDAERTPSNDYTLDVVVDADLKPMRNFPFFGVWGEVANPEDRAPVILQQPTKDRLGVENGPGQFDFGSGLENEAQRFYDTNIYDRFMRVGEFVTVEEDDEGGRKREYTLRITVAEPLVREFRADGRICDAPVVDESRIDALEGRVDQLADEVRKMREQLGGGNWRNIGRKLTTQSGAATKRKGEPPR